MKNINRIVNRSIWKIIGYGKPFTGFKFRIVLVKIVKICRIWVEYIGYTYESEYVLGYE